MTPLRQQMITALQRSGKGERPQEVRRLLNAATPLHHPVYFPTVYRLGLRLHEALSLQVANLDAQRMSVHVHRGKGAKDR